MNKQEISHFFSQILPYYIEAFQNIKSPHDLFEHKLKDYDQKFLSLLFALCAVFLEIMFQIFLPGSGIFLGLKYLPCLPVWAFLAWIVTFLMDSNREKNKVVRSLSIYGTLLLPLWSASLLVSYFLSSTLATLMQLGIMACGMFVLHKYFSFKFFKGKLGKIFAFSVLAIFAMSAASSLVFERFAGSTNDILKAFGHLEKKVNSEGNKESTDLEEDTAQKEPLIGEKFVFEYSHVSKEKVETNGEFTVEVVEKKTSQETENTSLYFRTTDENGAFVVECPIGGLIATLMCVGLQNSETSSTSSLNDLQKEKLNVISKASLYVTNAHDMFNGTTAMLEAFSPILSLSNEKESLKTFKPRKVNYKVDTALLRDFSIKNKETGKSDTNQIALNRAYSLPVLYAKQESESYRLEIEMISYKK